MIDAAPEAPEFANSLQCSFGNLGVSAGTVVGGWFIAKRWNFDYSVGWCRIWNTRGFYDDYQRGI